MPIRSAGKRRQIWIACATLVFVWACQRQEEETRLRLQLNPSLGLVQYDSIQVDLVQTNDTSTVLNRLFAGPFDSMPSSWPLPPNLHDGDFTVRVRAYRFEDQLGIQLLLLKQANGQQVATRSNLPEPVPYSRALQSVGVQSGVTLPAFDTSLADTNYQIAFPFRIDTAKMVPIPVDARARLFGGENDSLFTPGDTLRIALDSTTAVAFKITLRNHGVERRYHFILNRDSTIP